MRESGTFGYGAEGDERRLIGIAAGGPERRSDACHCGEDYVLHVQPMAQRRGVGWALMRAVSARLAADGMTTLLVWVARENTPARRFYAALGGQVVREQVRGFGEGTLLEVAYGWRDTAALRHDNDRPTF
ncbi:MAG: GNAT family N-acetyltransferase [Thermomicrobiales bacterium]